MAVSSGGSPKIGRNKVKCSNYSLMSRKTTNKKRELTNHLKTNPLDLDAKKAFKAIKK